MSNHYGVTEAPLTRHAATGVAGIRSPHTRSLATGGGYIGSPRVSSWAGVRTSNHNHVSAATVGYQRAPVQVASGPTLSKRLTRGVTAPKRLVYGVPRSGPSGGITGHQGAHSWSRDMRTHTSPTSEARSAPSRCTKQGGPRESRSLFATDRCGRQSLHLTAGAGGLGGDDMQVSNLPPAGVNSPPRPSQAPEPSAMAMKGAESAGGVTWGLR